MLILHGRGVFFWDVLGGLEFFSRDIKSSVSYMPRFWKPLLSTRMSIQAGLVRLDAHENHSRYENDTFCALNGFHALVCV